MEGLLLGSLFIKLILLAFSIFVLVICLRFLIHVPRFLEDIAISLRFMCLRDDDPSDDVDNLHPADAMADKIKNCETFK